MGKNTLAILLVKASVAFLLMAYVVSADDVSDTLDNNGKFVISGNMGIDGGGFQKARLSKNRIQYSPDHVWFEHAIARLNFDITPHSGLTIKLSPEFRQYINMFPYFYIYDKPFQYMHYNDFYLHQAQGIISLINNGEHSLELAIGYMPYKYNSEVRGLGEFLFRSGTYPFYLITEFDEPYARLTGVKATYSGGNDNIGGKIDLLWLTETQMRPFFDLSYALIASAHLSKIVDLGCGIDFARLTPANSKYTTPEYFKKGDSTLNVDDQYITGATDSTPGDTGYYTFSGTKIMWRATISPLGFINDNSGIYKEIMGPNGFKIYYEGAIIGLKNYPANGGSNPYGYDKINQKMPHMLGINIPAWKILDVLTFEIELYPSHYANDYYRVVQEGQPLPVIPKNNSLYDSSFYSHDRTYWIIYMKKQIVKNFSLTCQIGRDHQRWEMSLLENRNYDFEDATVKQNEWGWRLKADYNF